MVLEDLEVEVSEPYNNEDGYEQTNTQRFFVCSSSVIYYPFFPNFFRGKII